MNVADASRVCVGDAVVLGTTDVRPELCRMWYPEPPLPQQPQFSVRGELPAGCLALVIGGVKTYGGSYWFMVLADGQVGWVVYIDVYDVITSEKHSNG